MYGLGASGLAATDLLRSKGVSVVACDDRPATELNTERLAADELIAGGALTALPSDVDLVVVSPGVAVDRPLLEDARRRAVPVLAEIELAFHYLENPLLAITGSNGKSTTTALVGALLEGAGREAEVCGNIGVPMSARIEGSQARIFVVEVSSFQLEHCVSFRPNAGALLNVTPDHLDRHHTLEEYFRAKTRLFRCQSAGDVAILNADDPLARECPTPSGVRRRLFSRHQHVEDGCYLKGTSVVEVSPDSEERTLFELKQLTLAGDQNLENAMAAALLARSVDERLALEVGLGAFRGLAHRLERVGEIGGVTFFDDSKATNPAATERSLSAFRGSSVHLILGGRHKGADFESLRQAVGDKVRRVYLIGEAADELAGVLAGTAPVLQVGTLEKAVTESARRARSGESVLLSPACASFDQFRNFEHRGDVFKALVSSLISRWSETGGAHG